MLVEWVVSRKFRLIAAAKNMVLWFTKLVNNTYYFSISACLVIFFYFLQSDWLQQRAAFYDILTVAQKCYFLKTNQGVELIVELE